MKDLDKLEASVREKANDNAEVTADKLTEDVTHQENSSVEDEPKWTETDIIDEKEDIAKVEIKNPTSVISIGKAILSIFSVGIAFFAAFMVLYFIWGPARGEFHSDSTDTLYWAEAAMQGNGLINPDFKYAALMPLGGNLFMQLWIPFFGVSMLTHTLGMTTFFIVFIAAMFWLLTEMKWSMRWKGITIGGMLMVLSSSAKLREIFWGHIIYYSLGALFLMIGLAMVLHIYNLYENQNAKCKKLKLIINIAVLFLIFTALCTNSSTALALFALPILGAVFCERFLDHSSPLINGKTAIGSIIFIVCGISIAAGTFLGQLIANGVTAPYANAYSRFSETDTWWEHVESLPLAFLNLLGLNITKQDMLMSLNGISTIILIAFALLLVILPMAALLCYNKIKDTGTKLLIISHFISTAFIIIGYICGMLNVANWRLSPTIVTGFLVSVAFMRWIYRNSEIKRLAVLLLMPAAFVSVNSAMGIANLPADSYLENTNYKLAQYLKEQNLNYGYASFWYSQAITVQADSEVKVRNVKFKDGVIPEYYQGNKNWYIDQEGQEEYFLLMNQGEYSDFINSGSNILEKDYRELEYDGFHILVFNENIFKLDTIS